LSESIARSGLIHRVLPEDFVQLINSVPDFCS
jgi:hypothetical protein